MRPRQRPDRHPARYTHSQETETGIERPKILEQTLLLNQGRPEYAGRRIHRHEIPHQREKTDLRS